MTVETILWRRLDRPGCESARLYQLDGLWRLEGFSVFTHEGQGCGLQYRIICGPDWQTQRALVSGWLGQKTIEVEIEVISETWLLNHHEAPGVSGAIDVDLNFSPSTNLLPIRRLNLAVGEEAAVKAAWLHFPSFDLELLEQSYRRISKDKYRYESAGGAFVRDLEVSGAGFVTSYPDFFIAEETG